MARSFESLKPEYGHLWTSCQIRPAHRAELQAVAKKIIANRGKYERVAQRTGVPWYVTGIIHAMECDKFPAFTQHLHNGDRLDRKTRLVPAGRPAGEWPPADGVDAWEESAVDALTMKGKQFDKIKDWGIERIAYVLESYNGWGYRGKGVNSAYLWSYTNQYSGGKYIRDHVWSATAVSEQCGAMALLKVLFEIDATLTDSQSIAALPEPERAWPKAEVPPTAYAAVAARSTTVRSLIAAGLAWIFQMIEQAFSILPDATTEMESMMAPLKTLSGALKLNIVPITSTVALVCLVVAIVRHVRDKKALTDIKGN
jgi:lysozyme family protein